MHTFFDNFASHRGRERAALPHSSLWMEDPTWAAAGGRGPSWPGWTASVWTERTEPGLKLWNARTDCAAAELRTARGKIKCQLFVETL